MNKLDYYFSIKNSGSNEATDNKFYQYLEGTITELDDSSLTTIRTSAFQHNYQLISVYLHNIKTIGNNAFANCSKLINVNLPNATKLGTYVFQSSTALPSIDLPNVIEIESGCFSYCYALKTIILRSTTLCSLKNVNVFQNMPIATSTEEGFIYVPDDLVEQYKVATNWSTYASKIKPISELETGE